MKLEYFKKYNGAAIFFLLLLIVFFELFIFKISNRFSDFYFISNLLAYFILGFWFYYETQNTKQVATRFFLAFSNFLLIGFNVLNLGGTETIFIDLYARIISVLSLLMLILAIHFLKTPYKKIRKLDFKFGITFILIPCMFYVITILPFLESKKFLIISLVYFVINLLILILFELKKIDNPQIKNLFYFSALLIYLTTANYGYYFLVEKNSWSMYFYIFCSIFYRYIINFLFIDILQKDFVNK